MNSSLRLGIQSSLAGIRRPRALTRVSAGLLIVLLTSVGLIAALFGLDLLFHFGRVERAGLLIALAAVVAWCSHRWLLPALACRETDLQLALWIEGAHPAHRGLLANGLQFAAVDRGSWGSHSLEQATVDEISRLDRLPPLVDPQATRCGRLVLGGLLAMAAVGGVIQAFPEESQVFANRLLLGNSSYPTRTIINRIVVNGIQAFPAPQNRDAVRIPAGESLEFTVECRGVTPDRGTVHVVTDRTGQEGTLILEPVERSPSTEAFDPNSPAPVLQIYSATGNRLLDDLLFRVRIGDAVTELMRIEAILHPAISIEIEASPPDDGHGSERIQQVGSPPQISVPAGSQTQLKVGCRNKALRSVTLRVDGSDFPLERNAGDGRSFSLRANDTPLANVAQPLAYEISVVDADGLGLREPMRGLIGVVRDEPPRVALSVTTLHVLADAEPSLTWTATDDHGVESVRLQWQVAGMTGSREGVIPLYARTSGTRGEKAAQGTSRLSLAPLKATPGDEIRLTLVAVDERGTLSGTEGTSEPVLLHVTDEAGILSALAAGDHKAAAELDELIERQLRSGAGQ